MPGSNFGWDTGCSESDDYSWFSLVPPGQCWDSASK
jgi:hypothetical protein